MTQSAVMPSPEVSALAASLERVVVMIRKLAISPEISLTTASALRMLEVGGPSRLSELATAQNVTQPAMTQLVSRLERDGYARRGSDPNDARVVLVEITDAGRQLLSERRERRAVRLSELLDDLEPAERASILAATPALNLLASLGQTDEGSTSL